MKTAIVLAVSKVRYQVKFIYLRKLKLFEKRRVISKIKLVKKMNDTFLKHVSTLLLSSSVLNNTKYKVEFKVCNKMLIGQNTL